MRNKNAKSNEAYVIIPCSSDDQLTFPKNLCFDSGEQFPADSRNFCEDAGIVIYSVHTEMKALLAEIFSYIGKKVFIPILKGMKLRNIYQVSCTLYQQ